MEPAFCHLLLCVIRQEVLHGLDGGSQMAGVFHGNSQCQFHFLVCKCLEVSFHHIWEHNKKRPLIMMFKLVYVPSSLIHPPVESSEDLPGF